MSQELRDIRLRMERLQIEAGLYRSMLQLNARETRRKTGRLLRLLDMGHAVGRIVTGLARRKK